MINIRIDPKMKAGLEKLADKQLISVSTAIRQAIDKHLTENNIDWRKENVED